MQKVASLFWNIFGGGTVIDPSPTVSDTVSSYAYDVQRLGAYFVRNLALYKYCKNNNNDNNNNNL